MRGIQIVACADGASYRFPDHILKDDVLSVNSMNLHGKIG